MESPDRIIIVNMQQEAQYIGVQNWAYNQIIM